ncbi:hypothetical protein Tco_0256341 [Tanacetum coccineum]
MIRETGASFTQRTISSISVSGSIIYEGFLSSILLVVVIIVMVVFVVVVLVVVVISIVGVVIVVVFGIVVVVVVFAIDAACAFRAEEMPSLISCRMAAKVMAGVSDVDVLLGGILLTKDNTNKEKYQGSNSSDGGNIDDGVKIAGGVIGSGGEIEFSEELKELLSAEVETIR